MPLKLFNEKFKSLDELLNGKTDYLNVRDYKNTFKNSIEKEFTQIIDALVQYKDTKLTEIEIIFANQAKTILNYTDCVINCDIHTRVRTKRILKAAGAKVVFCDVDLRTLNMDPADLERKITPKTKAVMIAHTLGNPFDLKAVKEFCDRHALWLVEDNCDALGSAYTISGETHRRR